MVFKVKHWRKILIGVTAVITLAAGAPAGKQVYAAAADSSYVQQKMRITGFESSGKPVEEIKIRNKISQKKLIKQMPKTLTATVKGSNETVEIPVTWESVGDYEDSNYFYYQFNPVWDKKLYAVAAKTELPYVAVFIGTDANLKFSSAQENREIIYDFMKEEMGFNTAAACGVLANIHAESSFRPTASMIDTNGLLSYGICQWNGVRYTALQNYCAEHNLDYQTVEGQLQYLKYELEHSEASACARVKNVENTAEGAYTAGYNWARYFERCSSVYFETRANLAQNTYWPMYSTGERRTKYTITYNLDGGRNHDDNPHVYYETTETITLKDPVRNGYFFRGWYTDSKMKNQIKTISGSDGKNLVLYAKWVAIHYNIQFNGNGSQTGQMDAIKNCEFDCLYTLSANKYKKTGYKFTGWNTKKDGKGKSYANKEDVQNLTAKDGATVILYAQWKLQGYAIKYVLDGGENHDDNPSAYNINTNTIQFKDPKRTGCTFLGWYKDKNYTNKISGIPKGSSGKITLYAKWRVHSYRVVYNGNGATSGTMSKAKQCKYGKSYKLAVNKFKKKNYVFVGWNTQKDGSGRMIKNKGKIKNLTTKDNTTITLYAQWNKKSYTITYMLNGGIQILDNPTVYYADTKTFRLNSPEREGYTFEGWYTDSNFQNRITKVAKGTKKNLTLFAKWTVNRYTVRFDGNGADAGMTNVMSDCQYGTQYVLSVNGYQKTGYQFLGWNTKADGSGVFYKDTAIVENLAKENGAEVILYAQWEKV